MKSIATLMLAVILNLSVSAAPNQPEYLDSFNPTKGFKPAQRDLTEIFLQIAGSLEQYGSPEPYLRHMAKEHTRIEAAYRQKYGKASKSSRPIYMTDEYIDRTSANWNLLAPKIELSPYAKDFGHMMRDAIKGTRGSGTIIVQIFNDHQSAVFEAMAGKANNHADFESLRAELNSRLELDKDVVDEEKYEIARRDAVSFALGIHGITKKLFKRLEQVVPSNAAEKIKTVLTSMIMDVGQMAQSELEAGISEWSFRKSSTATK